LEFHEDKDSLYKREAELVNEQVLTDPMNMNLRLGGKGGWDCALRRSIESGHQRNMSLIHHNRLKQDDSYAANYKKSVSTGVKQNYDSGWMSNYANGLIKIQSNNLGNTPDAIKKRKETFENIGHQQGEKNSQFGTCWIHSIELQECKKIKKDDLEMFLEQGWIKGRKMKFKNKARMSLLAFKIQMRPA
jgi:hypothetical protein